ncbi:MAG: Sensor histidine kinase RcsC [Anaerolineae bacterium]|nr:Sensor histidine kinase RcsC [Anaerolineae bacterium]
MKYAKWISVVLSLIFLTSASPLLAQGGDSPRFEHITVEDGLSNSAVLNIVQDDDGLMWFSTLDGVNKFDGDNITVYQHNNNDPHSLSNNTVMTSYKTKDGTLWFGTDPGGLNKYNKATDQFTAYKHNPDDPNSLSNDAVWAITQDHTGVLWVGTRNGLNRFDPATETFKAYLPDPDNPRALSHSFVLRILEDSTGTLWVGTRSGLNRLDPATDDFTVFKPDPANPHSIASEQAWDIYEDSRGTLWIATRGGGLNKFDRSTGQFFAYRHNPDDPTSISDDNVWKVLEDHSGNLWVATERGGLNKFDRDTEQFVSYQNDPNNPLTISQNDIFWLYEDNGGVLWLGGRKVGISKLYPALQRFGLYRRIAENPLSLNNSNIAGIWVDQSGVLWVGTQGGGLNRFDRANNSMTYYTHNPDDPTTISSDNIYALFQTDDGTLWVSTQGGGLNRFDSATETFTAFTDDPNNPDDLLTNFITNILPAEDGQLWLGTLGFGLEKFNPATGTAIHYRNDPANPNSLSEGTIYALYRDKTGNLWIGTARGGVNKFNPQTEQFISYQNDPDNPNSLSHNGVQAIFEDDAGLLWFGTQGGLSKFDPATETFTTYHAKDGLPNENIYGILPDDAGNLWLSTGKGLSRFNPQTETFRNFDVIDGLQSNQFNLFSYFRSPAGELFFGGSNGLTVFFGAQVTDNPYLPPVVLTDFQLFNQSITPGSAPLSAPINQMDNLTLTYDQSVFSFEFAALNYQISAKNQYRYKMDGFDKDWSPPSPKRSATYTNLSPGRYTFMVKASNNDGVWTDTPKTIGVTILPPWWQTLWFRVSMLGLGIGVVVGGFQWRVRQVKTYNRELEATIARRTAELRESEEKYRNVSERANDGIIIVQNETIRYCNPQFAALLGYASADILNSPVDQFIAPQHRASVIERHLRRLAGGSEPSRYETVFLHQNQTSIDVEINAGIMEYRGQPAVLAVVRDVTARKEVERILQEAKEKAEAANRAKSTFLATMSHELRTPLNSVLGYAQILKLDPSIGAEQREYLNIIEQSGDHLLGLINDILNLSKIEAGKVEIFPSEVNLPAFLHAVTEIIAIRANHKKLTFEVELDPTLPAVIQVDPQRLRQVLINILGNAVKFTDQGRVIFSVQKLVSHAANSTALIRFTVTDTGIGIAPENLKKIFDPFEQVGGAGYSSAGTGLGLPISRNLARLLGGDLQVTSQVGQGSTFWVELTVPVIAEQAAPAQAEDRRIVGLKDRQPPILVVDDNMFNRQLLVDLLSPLGFVVSKAGSSADALAQLAAHPFEAVITDLRMPDMDGFELISRLRANRESSHLLIIASSASVLGHDQQRSLDVGANAFVPKPVQVLKLLDILQHHLQLEWIYEAPPQDPKNQPSTLPDDFSLAPDILARLDYLTTVGDIHALRDYARHLQQTGELGAFGQTLEQLTKDFELDKIQALLNKYRGQQP